MIGIDIDENRSAAFPHDRAHGRDIRKGGRDDLARQPERLDHDLQSDGPVTHGEEI